MTDSKLTTNLASFSNKDFNIGAGFIKQVLWFATNCIFFKSANPINISKVWLLKIFGAKVGNGLVIKPRTNIKYPWKLKIGDNCWIGEAVWIDNLDEVVLENNVCISQGALLLTGNHNFKKQTFDLVTKPIHIKDGAWIGAKAVVTQGVVVGSHAVLSVLSVASKNLNDYGVYKGNPAILVGERVIS